MNYRPIAKTCGVGPTLLKIWSPGHIFHRFSCEFLMKPGAKTPGGLRLASRRRMGRHLLRSVVLADF